MNIDELHTQLLKLGAEIGKTTLQRWAADGLIPSSTHKRRKLGRPVKKDEELSRRSNKPTGRLMDYPDEAVEDAAAVWSIYRWSEQVGTHHPTIEVLKKTRYYAQEFYNTAIFNHKGLFVRDITTTRWRPEDIPPTYTLTTTREGGCPLKKEFDELCSPRWVGEGKQRLVESLFIHSSTYHHLIIMWLCTVEKVRHKVSLQDNHEIIFTWSIQREVNGNISKYIFEGVRVEKADNNGLKFDFNG
jgi:hypothetical protein